MLWEFVLFSLEEVSQFKANGGSYWCFVVLEARRWLGGGKSRGRRPLFLVWVYKHMDERRKKKE